MNHEEACTEKKATIRTGKEWGMMDIRITEAAKKELLERNKDGKKVRIYVSGIG